MTTEIARRTIRIRLDPKQDRPWQRKGFRHPNLIAWVDEHRAELIHAALVLIQAWIAAGKPAGKVTLGSFERWATVMGGILDTADVGGFLTNLDEFYEAADLEGAIWRQFVAVWWDEHKDTEVGTKDLFALTDQVEGFDFGKGNQKAQQTSFGMQLAKQRDRVIGEHRIVFARIDHKIKKWRLIPTTIDSLLPPVPPDEGQFEEKGTPADFSYDTKGNEQGGVPRGTNLNPHIGEDDILAPAYVWGKVPQGTPSGDLEADFSLRDKEKPEGVPFFEGTPPNLPPDVLRAWAECVWSGEPTGLVPWEVQQEARKRGIPYDSFETPQRLADRVMRWFDEQGDDVQNQEHA